MNMHGPMHRRPAGPRREGAFEFALGTLRTVDPAQFLHIDNYSRQPGFGAGGVFVCKEIVESLHNGGSDLTEVVVSSGYIDILVGAMRAAEHMDVSTICPQLFVYGVMKSLADISGQ